MKALRLLTLMAVCCATGTMTSAAWGAEPAPAKPASKPASESAARNGDEQSSAPQSSAQAEGTQGEESAADLGGNAEEQRAAAAKPKASGKGGSPDRFTPSEQVRADFDVSFPIDI